LNGRSGILKVQIELSDATAKAAREAGLLTPARRRLAHDDR
jgi:hypothetical protein